MNKILVGKDINFLAKLDYGFFYDIIVFMIGSSLSNRMKRVFLNSAHKLGLLWNGSNYVLKDFKKPFCHPLEVCLIGVDNLSGKKIKDIQKVTKKSLSWILGFHHGFINKPKKFDNSDYLIGYDEGLLFNKENETASP